MGHPDQNPDPDLIDPGKQSNSEPDPDPNPEPDPDPDPDCGAGYPWAAAIKQVISTCAALILPRW